MNNLYTCIILIVIYLAVSAEITCSQPLVYPDTLRVTTVDEYHGVKVSDPYRWMEDASSPKLKDWIRSQDRLLKNFANRKNSRRLEIKKRISELVNYESYTNATGFITPYVSKRGKRYFFIKTYSGKKQPILFMKDGINSAPKAIYDLTNESRNKRVKLWGYEPSPNAKRVVLFLSIAGSRWLTLRILDIKSGKILPDKINGIHLLGGNVAWKQDSTGFFFTKFKRGAEQNGRASKPETPQIFFHTFGTRSSDSPVVEKPSEKDTLYSLKTTIDGNYLVISEVNGRDPNNRVYYMELDKIKSLAKPIIANSRANFSFLGNKGSRFWFYTNQDAPFGKVVSIDVKDPQPNQWREIIAETKEAISAGSSVGGNAVGIFGDKLVLLYMKDSSPIVRLFDLSGILEHEIAMPSGGSIWGGFSGNQNDPDVFYQFLSLTSTGSFYRLNVKTKNNKIFLAPKLNLDRANYETKQVFYKSKDGTRIPMFIAYRKGVKLGGDNPTLMYGYGAFGWVAFMWYQPHIITWLDMGGIYAVPGIRGGGEYGKQLHRAGIKQNKQNSIDDYIAATEWLIENKYTNPQKMVANGGSASSVVAAAAAIMQRPDLYAAVVIDIPIFDMIRFREFSNGRYWLSEFGSVDNKKEFATLLSISPYHNLKKDKCYPPTLIMAGEHDKTAVPLHAYKFTANMQHAQGCKNPVLMKMMWGAGHNFGATPEQRIDSWTDELAFLFEVLK